jgi:hypothetical protein
MKNSDLIRSACSECKQEFDTKEEEQKHFHMLNAVHNKEGEPLCYLILLPSGVKAGTMNAAREYGVANAELRKKYPDKKFQLVPHGYFHLVEQLQDNRNNTVTYQYEFLESLLAFEV